MKLSTNMNNICSIPNIYDNRVLLSQFRKETQHFRQIIIITILILIYNNKKLQKYLYVFGKKEEKDEEDNFITTSICFLLYSKLSCYG
jgi:hypothetical protein